MSWLGSIIGKIHMKVFRRWKLATKNTPLLSNQTPSPQVHPSQRWMTHNSHRKVSIHSKLLLLLPINLVFRKAAIWSFEYRSYSLTKAPIQEASLSIFRSKPQKCGRSSDRWYLRPRSTIRSPQPSSVIRYSHFNHISLTDHALPIVHFHGGITFDAQLLFWKVH